MKQKIQSRQFNQNRKPPLIIMSTLVLSTLIIGGSVYFWQSSKLEKGNESLQNQKTTSHVDVNKISYDLVNNRCTTSECLFNINKSNYPLGIAVIKGYYTPTKRSAWEETKECDGFTITSGSPELIRAMVDLVDQGNTVHSKNQLNQPVINLGLEMLSPTERQSVFDSSMNNQIELVILSDSPTESEVPVCYQDVIVLRKK